MKSIEKSVIRKMLESIREQETDPEDALIALEPFMDLIEDEYEDEEDE